MPPLRLRLIASTLVCALGWGAVLASQAWAQGGSEAGAGTQRERTEARLREIRDEIKRVQTQIGLDAAERDRYARGLREAEKSVSAARTGLDRLRRERAARNAARARLAAERRERVSALDRARGELATQMRAAYMVGREEPLKLLLTQKEPARAGRMFAYYSYFGRARAAQIAQIDANVSRVDALDVELRTEEMRLADLEARQREELARLEASRQQRKTVVADLRTEARSRVATLERLRAQQSSLESLLRQLRRTIERFPSERLPSDDGRAFARLRGKLAWPVGGRVVARFGETRAGGLKWDGVLIATERGSPVRSVYRGRVIYADWLAGLGLLVIVDHGEGYLSLYGHNEQILKSVGDGVTAGEPLATAGDTGGRTRPELYFEIRRGGRPVDPRAWVRGPLAR